MGPIFLCHVNEDKKAVGRVYEVLRTAGFEVCIDLEAIANGREGEAALANKLRQATCMLVFLSKNSVRKIDAPHHEFGQTIDMWQDAAVGTLHAIPLRINSCEIPDIFSGLHHIDLFEDRGLERLICRLHEDQKQRQSFNPARDPQGPDQALRNETQDDVFSGSSGHAVVYDSRGEIVDVPEAFAELHVMPPEVLKDDRSWGHRSSGEHR